MRRKDKLQTGRGSPQTLFPIFFFFSQAAHFATAPTLCNCISPSQFAEMKRDENVSEDLMKREQGIVTEVIMRLQMGDPVSGFVPETGSGRKSCVEDNLYFFGLFPFR